MVLRLGFRDGGDEGGGESEAAAASAEAQGHHYQLFRHFTRERERWVVHKLLKNCKHSLS